VQKAISIAALLLFIAAAAGAVNSTYETRRKQLADEAEAQQKKLGLDRPKAYAQYPTPEVSFEGEPARVSCGGTASVSLTGKFAKGTAFLVSDDDVQIVEQKPTATGWQANLKVASAATPRNVQVHAIVPVSGAESAAQVLRIRARYDLDLKFEDGWTAHFATAQADESGQLGGDLVWKKGAETRTTPAQIDFSDTKLRVAWQRSQEEMDAQQAAADKMQSLGGGDVMQKVMARIEECMKKGEAERNACLEKAGKQNDADMAALKQKADAIAAEGEAKKPAAAWGCSDANLEASNGALSGTASCTRERKQKVSGTLKCVGPVSGE
jgi:hypothetical protein